MNIDGQLANVGMNALLRGLEAGELMRSRKDKSEWNAEVRQRQREQWGEQDKEKYTIQGAQALQAVSEARRTGADPTPYLQQANDAFSKAGRPLGKVFDHRGMRYGSSVQDSLKQGYATPEAIEDVNFIHGDDIRKGLGPVKSAYTIPDGSTIPAGAKIVDKVITNFYPSPDKKGIIPEIETHVELPDGRKVAYKDFATVGRGTGDDDPALVIPLDRIMDDAKGMSLLQSGVAQLDQELPALLASYGVQQPERKAPETRTVQRGDQNVTEEMQPDGTWKEIGRGGLSAVLSARERNKRYAAGGSGGTAGGGVEIQNIRQFGAAYAPPGATPEEAFKVGQKKYAEFKRSIARGDNPVKIVGNIQSDLLKQTKPALDENGQPAYGATEPMYTPEEARAEAIRIYQATAAELGVDADRQLGGNAQPAPDLSDDDEALQFVLGGSKRNAPPPAPTPMPRR